jgi:hypothetical protein
MPKHPLRKAHPLNKRHPLRKPHPLSRARDEERRGQRANARRRAREKGPGCGLWTLVILTAILLLTRHRASHTRSC